ncbi:hypothetical protein JX265_002497 [Neoarthrinium moseri]|uniref:Uncharacterized protein n=1 Tax=Neoarthrinium moseri TaxID=1658444 RepID=A0A9P9WUI8_9PEZI|nr:uncharacterized protein JN550_000311 [Neoarthrinium moseri]KAI1854858.1 hypothetical protein JX266_000976 [Neoarthrinium moseri]KAI1878129.1 hypothetical protein JN550_000311 [Neoarthrinium moseri]KAI1879543.1 hypothetical protein JX265_002497 [Neoarthrinium moseri]
MEKKRLTFQLDTPYSSVDWPQVTAEDQDTILELLCSLLSPIGRHRTQHKQPSRGKGDKKRKRREAEKPDAAPAPPPAPEISSYVDVGLSTITRNLQSSIAEGVDGAKTDADASKTSLYSVIVVARSGQPNILHSHLPQIVAVASETHPSTEPIRLVGISKACQDRLCEALGIPRVSCVGLREGAPNSKALVDFARQRAPPIEVTWLKEAQKAEFRETKIKTVETVIGSKKPSRK